MWVLEVARLLVDVTLVKRDCCLDWSHYSCVPEIDSFPLSMLFWSGFNYDGMGQDLLRSWSLFSVIFMIMTSKLLCKSCANVISLK